MKSITRVFKVLKKGANIHNQLCRSCFICHLPLSIAHNDKTGGWESDCVSGAIFPPFLFFSSADFTSQSNVHVLTQVASQIRARHGVISPWVAGHIEAGPPTGDREHFISHWHVHLYPHRPAGGCRACQPWGNKERKGKKKNSGLCQSQNNMKTTLWPQYKASNKIAWISWESYSCFEFWHPHSVCVPLSLWEIEYSPRNHIILRYRVNTKDIKRQVSSSETAMACLIPLCIQMQWMNTMEWLRLYLVKLGSVSQ